MRAALSSAADEMPRFAANLSMMFTEVGFLDRFAEAAQAGFRAVEFLFPYAFTAKEIADRAKANALEIVLFNAPPGDWDAGDRGLASLPGREHEFSAGIATALRYAQALGTTRLHVMAGVLPPEADAEERARRMRLYVRHLRLACEEAAPLGITVTIEPLNPRDVPRYLIARQDEAHAVREAVGMPNLRVQMDLYHCQIVEGDLSEKLRRWIAHVGHVQVAGVPARHEPDVGEVNYAYLFKLLDDLRYDGWVGCEYRPAKGTVEGLGWLYRLLDRRSVG